MSGRKRKLNRRPHWFYCEVYQYNFYFCPGYSREELSLAIYNNFKVIYPPDDLGAGGSCTMIENDAGHAGTFIWMRNPEDLDVLVHECVHAANDLLGRRGVQHDWNNDEAHAYYTQWLFNKCWSILRK